nr:unnamed protein product [Callosobruchus chinensis]
MVAEEQDMKIELGEVKVEKAEVDIESFGIVQNSLELRIEGEDDERTDRILELQRIKDEHSYVKAETNMEVLQMQGTKIKVEKNWKDCKPFKPTYITKEEIIEQDSDDEFIDGNSETGSNSGPGQVINRPHLVCKESNHTIREHPDFLSSVSNKSHKCEQGTYKTVFNSKLHRHMLVHSKSAGRHKLIILCDYCNARVTSKQKLDEHIIRKHPDSVASVSSKIYNCEYCSYQTSWKSRLTQHMNQHNKLSCRECDRKFTSRKGLDEHVIRKHPDSIASVSSKIYNCEYCLYQTSWKSRLTRHMNQHNKLSCRECDQKFNSRKGLDEHVIRKHPDSIASVSSKIHHCEYCPYQTAVKSHLTRHMNRHNKLSCRECNRRFNSRKGLDEHVIRKHPDSIASVSSKIHHCEYCPYQTAVKSHLTRHMNQHNKLSCRECDRKFNSRKGLDEHVIRKHPDSIASVSSKIHHCEYCPYQTVVKSHLTRHMNRHNKLSCRECNRRFNRRTGLDEHIIRKHPDSIASVSSKIYNCEYCLYQTSWKSHLTEHMNQHNKLSCRECDRKFNSRKGLDEHVIRKHPHCIASVSSKLHECAQCSHMLLMMENEMVAEEQDMKIEVGEVKVEKAEVDIESFGIVQNSLELRIEGEDDERTDRIIGLQRIKDDVKAETNMEVLQMQGNKIKVEKNWKDCKPFKPTYITKEEIIEQDSDDEFIDGNSEIGSNSGPGQVINSPHLVCKESNHTIREHPDFLSSVSNKSHKCEQGTYKTVFNSKLHRHMSVHSKSAGRRKLIILCDYCNARFPSKQKLDEHIIRKHPDSIASVSGKIHDCEYCPYQTAVKSHLIQHMNRHNKLSCRECNRRFNKRTGLDEHIIRKHPDSIASVSSKIHDCEYCPYQTVVKSHLTRHMNRHNKLSCRECNRRFNSRTGLDEHIIRKHPDSIASVSGKIHDCEYCPYQTALKSHLTQHMNRHNKLSCRECNRRFNSRTGLDEHIIRKHPDSIASVSSKIHDCEYCPYQTVLMMENEMVAEEQDMKIELGEVKVEKAEVDIESFGIVQNSLELRIEGEDDERTDRILELQRIKDDVKAETNMEVLQMQGNKIKVEKNWKDCKPFKPTYITKEEIIEQDSDDEFIDGNSEIGSNSGPGQVINRPHLVCKESNHTIREHPDFLLSVSNKSHKCEQGTYKTVFNSKLHRHMLVHSKTAGRRKLIILCDYCNARFTSKQKLDEHIIRKHPDSIASVSSKIYNCEYCLYQTSWKSCLTRHMNQHNKLSCRECDQKFISRKGLDEHVIRKHPDSIASVSSKIYNCEYCLYQTSWKSRLTRHMNQHKLSCRECDQKFTSRKGLDEHVIRKHPDSIASVSSKIYNCEYCIYQTSWKSRLTRHMNQHKLSCRECDQKFTSRKGLDEHVIRKHPDSIASVSSKIYNCEYCLYQTSWKSCLTRHMNQHNKLSCRECDQKFTSRKGLDEHVIRKHPDSIASVSSKIYNCEYCLYQTSWKSRLTRHMNQHKLSCRECDQKFTSRKGLDEHVIRKHPDSIASVSSKIYNCEYCLYQTLWKSWLTRHMNQHNKLSCRECDQKFTSRKGLDEHVIRKHPDSIASVSTIKLKLHRHMLVHSKNGGRRKLIILCDYCNARFTSKRNLDEHIIRKHPDSIASVSSKIHDCEYCPYQTVLMMENEMVAEEQDMKIELGEVKVEKAEVDIESFGIVQNSLELRIEGEDDERTDRILELQRIKDEHSYVKAETNMEVLQMQGNKIKVEKSWKDCKPFKPTYITKEDIIEQDSDDEFIDGNSEIGSNSGPGQVINRPHLVCKESNHTIREHPDFLLSVSNKSHKCEQGTYKTVFNSKLHRHMLVHSKTAGRRKLIILCDYCNARFKCKRNLDEHVIRKHPHCIASVSSKLHECAQCSYKTAIKLKLHRHMLVHSKSAGLRKLVILCDYCNARFPSKQKLDDHIIRKHPDSIASVSGKIHDCEYCPYQTAVKSHLTQHMNRHNKLSCRECNRGFNSRSGLDEHIIRKHPDSIASVSGKIHDCEYCPYQTALKSHLTRHMNRHNKLSCRECDRRFNSKKSLDEHVIRKHPHCIASVSSKLHECAQCSYKTVIKLKLHRHMLLMMENEMVAEEQDMKIELGEVKVEKAEVDIESFGIVQNSLELRIEGEDDERTDRILELQRIKDEHSYVKAETNMEVLQMQGNKIKVEKSWKDCKPFKPTYITKEDIIEQDSDDEFIDGNSEIGSNSGPGQVINRPHLVCKESNHTIREHPDFLLSVSNKSHKCEQGTYKTVFNSKLHRHMLVHSKTAGRRKLIILCNYCNLTFKCKRNLDEHVIRKYPDSIASVSSKIYNCEYCPYQTSWKSHLTRHMNQHNKLSCKQCDESFNSRKGLDEHVIRKHPHCIASVSSKLHECAQCSYKTAIKLKLHRHMLVHSKNGSRRKLIILCDYCNATFTRKRNLDEHIIRKHPDSIASVSSKIHDCEYCPYQTAWSRTGNTEPTSCV